MATVAMVEFSPPERHVISRFARTIITMPQPQPADSADIEVPRISVVICTYNRASLLPSCLHALAQQTIRDQVQVIVVDDGSTHDTASVVADFDVEYVPLGTNQGLSAARNAGVALARAPIVAFTDDDVVVPPEWCASLCQAWDGATSATRAIGGAVTVLHVESLTQRYLVRRNPLSPVESEVAQAQSFIQRLRAYLINETSHRDTARPVFSLVGANMSFHRESLLEVGGFDPTIRFGGDEEFVCVNLRKRFGDQSILFVPSIVVAHDFDPHLRDTLRRAFHYGISNGRTWARSGGIPGLRPVGGLFVLTFLFAAPFSLLAATVISLLVPFTMWRRWMGQSLAERNPEVAFYPLIALAQELFANIGFVIGWRRELRTLR